MEESRRPSEEWELDFGALATPEGTILSLSGELDAHTLHALHARVSSTQAREGQVLILGQNIAAPP